MKAYYYFSVMFILLNIIGALVGPEAAVGGLFVLAAAAKGVRETEVHAEGSADTLGFPVGCESFYPFFGEFNPETQAAILADDHSRPDEKMRCIEDVVRSYKKHKPKKKPILFVEGTPAHQPISCEDAGIPKSLASKVECKGWDDEKALRKNLVILLGFDHSYAVQIQRQLQMRPEAERDMMLKSLLTDSSKRLAVIKNKKEDEPLFRQTIKFILDQRGSLKKSYRDIFQDIETRWATRKFDRKLSEEERREIEELNRARDRSLRKTIREHLTTGTGSAIFTAGPLHVDPSLDPSHREENPSLKEEFDGDSRVAVLMTASLPKRK